MLGFRETFDGVLGVGFGGGEVDGAVDDAGVAGAKELDEEKGAVVEGGADETGELDSGHDMMRCGR